MEKDTSNSKGSKGYDQIYISMHHPDSPSSNHNFIWIKPTNMGFNDFGYRSTSDINLVRNNKVVFTYQAKVAVWKSEENMYVGSGDLLQNENGPSHFIDGGSREIFSIGQDQNAYRRVIGSLGVSKGQALLQNVNDLVAISNKEEKKNTFKAAKESEVLKYSLLRNSETYYALKNSLPILHGLKFEEISRGPENVEILIPNGSGQNAHINFKFDYTGEIPRRTCVLIGKNGVGKSSALGEIARRALKVEKKGTSSDLDRISASRILVFTPNNEFTGIFPGQTRKNPATYYKRLFTSRTSNSRSGKTATSAIVDLARYTDRIKDESRYGILLKSIEILEKPSEICLRAQNNEFVKLTQLKGGGEQRILNLTSSVQINSEPGRLVDGKFYHLSTGEVRFIKIIAQACLYIENGSLLLFDEPETHLHPNFISRLMNAIEIILAKTGSAAIIATHSVYVVREVFHDQVNVIEKVEDGQVAIKSPGMRTFGADISTISNFVFGEDDDSYLAQDVITRLLKSSSSFEEVREKYGDLLSREILSELRARFQEKLV